MIASPASSMKNPNAATTVRRRVKASTSVEGKRPERRSISSVAKIALRKGAIRPHVAYVANPLFLRPDAERLLDPIPQEIEQPVGSDETNAERDAVLRAMPAHLRRLCHDHLLTPREERALFQRMNYLKFLAAQLSLPNQDQAPSRADLKEAAALLSQAELIRNRVIAANVRLVVANVKLFTDERHTFDDLLSEGIVSMMRAVENFDYDRGFRFSTYATRAIRRNLYRYVIQRRRDSQRFCQSSDGADGEPADERSIGAFDELRWQQLRGKLLGLLRKLDPRERAIIRARFGMGDSEQAETLQSLAGKLGVCKERVRQLEQRAMAKLQSLAAAAKLEAPQD